MSTLCSIIVVTLNEAPHIARLKKAIDALDVPEDIAIETILIDGGSTDGTVEAAKDAGFTKTLVLPEASIPVCRNRGLAEATGDWIAFLDGDCEPSRDWLVTAIPFLEKQEPVIIGWPVVPPSPSTWVQRAWYTHWSFKNRSATASDDEPIRLEAFRLITTRNMLLTRTAADRLSGFDEKLPTGEDTDFVFRAYTQDMTVLGVPGLRVIHHGEPATLRDFFRQQIWHANRSSYQKILKSTGGKAGRNVILFSTAYAIALLLLVFGCISSIYTGQWIRLTLALPMAGVLLGPAIMIARRAKDLSLIPPLCALYAAYGLARMLDLFGFFRKKTTWKS